jgi:glycine cleavage system aminomethyltransferase T
MQFTLDSPLFKGASAVQLSGGAPQPFEYRSSREETLAARETAWLGVALNISPIFDIKGPDAVKFLNATCVNRDFGHFPDGTSKHVLICNDRGQMLADGVIIKVAEDHFRSYWLAPVIHYFLLTSGLDVEGEYISDEYFFQIDGPKSLEIMERATGTDLHDLRFARNKKITMLGADAVVHRLGMSGALAYEIHGGGEHADAVYARIREVLDEFGGVPQGTRNYVTMNHTVAGYPNQYLHFLYPWYTSGEGLAGFMRQANFLNQVFIGSAADDPENFYVTPFDVGWGYLVNFDHEFPGKDALLALKQDPPRQAVTLEWNADDVADVFASQFRGAGAPQYDPIEYPNDWWAHPEGGFLPLRGDYVLADGRKVGVASGKTYAYHERRMVSLAWIEKAFAAEGTEVAVLWGQPGGPQKEIRATVARFPYYNGGFRNETFDVAAIPRLVPAVA